MKYPKRVCYDCGSKAQTDPSKISTYATTIFGYCDVCERYEPISSVKNYGYPEFKNDKRSNRTSTQE